MCYDERFFLQRATTKARKRQEAQSVIERLRPRRRAIARSPRRKSRRKSSPSWKPSERLKGESPGLPMLPGAFDRGASSDAQFDHAARAAIGQSEPPVERDIGCDPDVCHARVEGRARGTVARSHLGSGARSARAHEADLPPLAPGQGWQSVQSLHELDDFRDLVLACTASCRKFCDSSGSATTRTKSPPAGRRCLREARRTRCISTPTTFERRVLRANPSGRGYHQLP